MFAPSNGLRNNSFNRLVMIYSAAKIHERKTKQTMYNL